MINAGHAIGLKGGKGLSEQHDIETRQGLHWRMLLNVALNLEAGGVPQLLILTWDERIPLNERNMPERHIAKHILLYPIHRIPVTHETLPRESFLLMQGHDGP